MAEIRLAEGTIRFQEEWLSAEDIKTRIKEKMDAGDMKFAELAAAAEELNQAMESAHAIEVRIVIPKSDYERLRKRGGDDDDESIRKAILAFIKGSDNPAAAGEAATPKKADMPAPEVRTVVCSKCQKKVEIPEGEPPEELECDFCGTSILLDAEENNEEKPAEAESKPEEKEDPSIRRKDHFLG